MKLIGACQPRSGTLSLLTAIERVGGRCYHMKVALENTLDGRGDLHKWFRIAELPPFDEERLRLLGEIFAGYDACADSPSCYVYEELMHLYPEAHVAVTKRDASKWLRSICDTVLRPYRFCRHPAVKVCLAIMELVWKLPVIGVVGLIGKMAALPGAVVLRPYLDENGDVLDFYDPRNHPEIEARFEDFIRSVERAVPAHKLIVLEAPYEDGYRGICPALGVEVPSGEPWPHVNDKRQINRSLDINMTLLVVVPVLVVIAAIGLVHALVTAPLVAAAVLVGVLVALHGLKLFLRALVRRTGRKDSNAVPDRPA